MSGQAGVHILALSGRDQMVLYYPRHQCVRVIWKRTTLRFTGDEFRGLVSAFEQSLCATDTTEGIVCLRQCEDGQVALRVEDVELRLPPIDYWLLGRLLETAWHRLSHSRPLREYPFPSNMQDNLN